MRPSTRHLLALFGAALVACGGGGDGTSGDGTEVAFAKTPAAVLTTESGAYTLSFYSSPSVQPTRGVNALKLFVTHTADGAAATDVAVDVVPFMPAMGHGSSVKPTVAPGSEPGTFTVSGLYFFMPGLWEIRTTIASSDHAIAKFDVP